MENRIPVRYRKLWSLAREGKVSPRKAIKAMCQQCVCYDQVNKAIKECDSKLCPLIFFKPKQK